jgi:hypothetical protein
MAVITGQEFREQWYAVNVSTKIISLGDLPDLPSFDPGDAYDLLAHHIKTEISRSTNLKEAILLGWIQVTKVVDSSSMTYTDSEAVDSVTSAEIFEIDEGSGGGGGQLVNAVCDGTNTLITITTEFLEPTILDSRSNDFIGVTIADDLTGLISLTAIAMGKIEIIE